MTNKTTTEVLIALERRLHNSDVRSDTDKLNELLDEKFIEFGASGNTFTKQQIIDSLKKNPILRVEVSNETVMRLATGVYLLTYVSINRGTGKNRISNRSSIWHRVNDQWKMIFHQGTEVRDA